MRKPMNNPMNATPYIGKATGSMRTGHKLNSVILWLVTAKTITTRNKGMTVNQYRALPTTSFLLLSLPHQRP
jgi:hypothetical protein